MCNLFRLVAFVMVAVAFLRTIAHVQSFSGNTLYCRNCRILIRAHSGVTVPPIEAGFYTVRLVAIACGVRHWCSKE